MNQTPISPGAGNELLGASGSVPGFLEPPGVPQTLGPVVMEGETLSENEIEKWFFSSE